MTCYKIPVIAGDGIGPEVIMEGKKVLDAVSEAQNFEIEWVDFPFGADYYLTTGELVTEKALKELEKSKVIYLGAVGDPRCPPGILEKGILLTLRFYLDQFVNLRPIQLYEGVSTPLRNKTAEDINFSIVRENTEDAYIGIGGNAKKGKKRDEFTLSRHMYNIKFGLDVDSDHDEIAYQLMVISRKGAERVIRYAFDLCKKERRTKVTSVDKANVLTHVYSLWRDVFDQVKNDYPGIETDFTYVDAITMWFVKNPEWFHIVVTPNMFGDIITDLGAIIQGGLGVAAGGNINPEGTSMFEPIHGSAPKYKGMERINPIATILAGRMMLDTLGEARSAKAVEMAVQELLIEGKIRTPDLGGTSKTSEVGDAVAAKAARIGRSL